MHISEEDFYETAQEEINTNIFVPIYLSSLVINLNSLKTIINVTSGLTFMSFAKVLVYYGTKSLLGFFALSMRH